MKVFGKCFVFSSLETEFYSWKVIYTNGLLQIQELALQSVSLEGTWPCNTVQLTSSAQGLKFLHLYHQEFGIYCLHRQFLRSV